MMPSLYVSMIYASGFSSYMGVHYARRRFGRRTCLATGITDPGRCGQGKKARDVQATAVTWPRSQLKTRFPSSEWPFGIRDNVVCVHLERSTRLATESAPLVNVLEPKKTKKKGSTTYGTRAKNRNSGFSLGPSFERPGSKRTKGFRALWASRKRTVWSINSAWSGVRKNGPLMFLFVASFSLSNFGCARFCHFFFF